MDLRLPADPVRNQLSGALAAMLDHPDSPLGIGHQMLDQAAGAGGLSPVRPEGVNRSRRLALILEDAARLGESQWRAAVESLVGQMRDGRWFEAVTVHPTAPTLSEICDGREAYVEPSGPGTRLAKVGALRTALSAAGWRLERDGSLSAAYPVEGHAGERDGALHILDRLMRLIEQGAPDDIITESKRLLEAAVKYGLEEIGASDVDPKEFSQGLKRVLIELELHSGTVDRNEPWAAAMTKFMGAAQGAALGIADLRNVESSAHASTRVPTVSVARARYAGRLAVALASAILEGLDERRNRA